MAMPSIALAQTAEKSMVSRVQQAIVKQTNEFREKNDLPPISVTEELAATATDFAKFMAKSGKYGHHADGQTPAQRAKAHGYQYCVVRENIAYRTNTGKVTADSLIDVFVQGWIDSPPHRENMLADYVTETGVAVATTDDVTYFAVQLFGRPKSAAIKLQVSNATNTIQTLVIATNDSEEEMQIPPNAQLTMTRCFPTKLALAGRDGEIQLSESAELQITDEGLTR
jgi:hypothetical protein